MNEDKFISKYKSQWLELEKLSEKAVKSNISSFSADEILRLTYLFRETSHHLSYARTYMPNSEIVETLNNIVARCHNLIYIREKFSILKILKYYSAFPKYFRTVKSFFFVSMSVFLLGFFVTFIVCSISPGIAEYIVPQFTPESVSLDPDTQSAIFPLLSGFIMTNNINVCITAFAGGILAGVGTLYILLFNGAVVGALSGMVFGNGGDMFKFWALILPHGFLELTAIFISGACGLILGAGLLVPKELKRIDSVVRASKKAVKLIPGIATMLVFAGLIEGFFTPLQIEPAIKYFFALFTLAFIILYFCFLSRDTDLQR